jgi:hypothetical protein
MVAVEGVFADLSATGRIRTGRAKDAQEEYSRHVIAECSVAIRRQPDYIEGQYEFAYSADLLASSGSSSRPSRHEE